jgi:hypothetical protein
MGQRADIKLDELRAGAGSAGGPTDQEQEEDG